MNEYESNDSMYFYLCIYFSNNNNNTNKDFDRCAFYESILELHLNSSE